MIDVDEVLRTELHRLHRVHMSPDWDEVVRKSGAHRSNVWLAGAAVAAGAVVVALTLALVTPLGATIVRGLDDFSSWLTGEPGKPATPQEQRAFDAANARSWVGFPKGTALRRLVVRRVGAATVQLLGFRSGSSALCLRIQVVGKSRASRLQCAPLDDLRRTGGPVRVVLADEPVGKGERAAWYGIQRFHSAALQITAGIAADGVRGVFLADDAGRHEVAVAANAFLYVATQPKVGQRVKRVWARTARGVVAVPFAPTPFGLGARGPARTAPPAPAIERHVTGGRVGWLERRDPRGQPLDVLPARMRAAVVGRRRGPHGETNVVFGRVLAPDPDRPLRIVLTLNSHRPGGRVAGLCSWFVGQRGGAGGCAPLPGVFDKSPFSSGLMGGGSATFVTVDGVASDDVARLEALLADGERAAVPLVDNTFVVDLPRAKLPARLVAYDAHNRVIGVSESWQDLDRGAAPARGRAKLLFRVGAANGEHAELLVGRSTQGGECMFLKHFVNVHRAGVTVGCFGRVWHGSPLQLTWEAAPTSYIGGRVRSDVKTVRIRFADGAAATVRPKRGYMLYAPPASRRSGDNGAVSAEGLDAAGKVVARQSLLRPRG